MKKQFSIYLFGYVTELPPPLPPLHWNSQPNLLCLLVISNMSRILPLSFEFYKRDWLKCSFAVKRSSIYFCGFAFFFWKTYRFIIACTRLFVNSSGRARINLYFSCSFAWKKNIIATIYYQEKKNNRIEGKHSVNSVANSNCLHSLL